MTILTVIGILGSIDMPQLPFEVYYPDYKKTVHVVGSCDMSKSNSIVMIFDSKAKNISHVVMRQVNKAFDMPGITRVQICRKDVML